jgi:serine phosphatase RsbU (regulator of sigma subunit)
MQNYLSQSEANWVQSHTLQLDSLLKENFFKSTDEFMNLLIDFVAELTNAVHGVFYAYIPQDKHIQAIAGYSCNISRLRKSHFVVGEGLVGQVFLNKKYILLDSLPAGYATLDMATVSLSLQALLILPLIFNDKVYGVVELSFLHNPSAKYLYFFEQIERSLAIMLERNANQSEVEKLLLETQDQKEQLNTQEEELRVNLEELTTIHESLQVQSQQIERAYQNLEVSNNRIVESINYAKRIQKTFLPTTESLQAAFEQHFVIYKPKDLVSGDFYWYHLTENKKIIATVDCTGHGVPGAFMSLLGCTLLNQAVSEENLSSPAAILDFLRFQIFKIFRNSQEIKDGMDLAVCSLEKAHNCHTTVDFAGSKSRLYYVKEGALGHLKSERHSIGGGNYKPEHSFHNQTIELTTADCLYLSTDGLFDICNAKRQRYGHNRFEFFAQNNWAKTMSEQEQLLIREYRDFQADQDQRDDITVLGLKI